MTERCISCGIECKSGFVKFKCPECGKAEIVRCEKCKKLTREYTCPNCGFVGP